MQLHTADLHASSCAETYIYIHGYISIRICIHMVVGHMYGSMRRHVWPHSALRACAADCSMRTHI